MFESRSHNIRVQVRPEYVPQQSHPDGQVFCFAYHVTIQNESSEPVQLLSRHWIIQDGLGRLQEVRGAGVVGLTPTIQPGETFNYSSFCPLPTPVGSMRGSYLMRAQSGAEFDAEIPLFILAEPSHYH